MRIPLGEVIVSHYPLKVLTCPFGCGETLVYTTNGVQCSDNDCASMGGPISRITPSSPYRHGDRVQLHGYAGEVAGHHRTGFRGVVTGALGSTILRGATDLGEEWDEYWGVLVPDGTQNRSDCYCTCCPRPVRKPAQLALFDLVAG